MALFVLGLPKGSPQTTKVGLLQLCGAITSCSDLWLRWSLKQSCSSHRELPNGVSHSICTCESRVDSQLFVVGLSFCHNLCCRCPNRSCKLILDIYTSIAFQWYKELLNARCFDLWNCSLKVRKSTWTPTPKKESSLGNVSLPSHILLGPRPWDLLPWSRAQG
jgi:hypothetical protein